MKINFGKIKKWLSLLLLSIYSLCSFSCNDLFSKDLHSDLLNGFTTKIHFYSDKEDSGQEVKKTTKRFEIGSTITLDDLPNYTDSEINNWKDKKRLSSWKIYRKTGSSEIIDAGITNLFVENVELDLYAIWDTQYKIIYNFQNADLFYESEEHIAYGPAGTSVSVTPSVNIPEGYEPISSSLVDLTINDDGSSSVEFTFDRKTVSLTFDPNGGFFSGTVDSNSFTGTYGAPIDTNAIPIPSKDGHRFLRWDPELPLTFPSTDTTYTAVYGGEECNISYADWKGGQDDAKAFSGDVSSLPSTYICGQECVIPVPEVSSTNTGSSAEFEGWYTDAGCSEGHRLGTNSSGDYVIPDTSTGDITLYAKWKYNWIYVDPQCKVDNTSDSNTGIGKNCPVKTISEALQYIKHRDCQIRAMSTISALFDRTNLKNITKNYNCILKNVNTDSNKPLIEVDVSGDFDFGELHIEDSISTYVIKVINGNLGVNGLTFNDGSDNKLPIYLSRGTTTKIANADSISGIPAFDPNVRIKIYSSDYQSFPQVLSAADGLEISSYCTQFESMHEGFEINEEGRLVTSSSIGINPEYPFVNKISLGELESAVAYVVGSQNILTFKVSDQAYDAIKDVSGSKKIKWTLSEDPSKTGESQITGNAGSYKAELDVTDLSLGMHSITITAESATEDDVLESIESVISVVK